MPDVMRGEEAMMQTWRCPPTPQNGQKEKPRQKKCEPPEFEQCALAPPWLRFIRAAQIFPANSAVG